MISNRIVIDTNVCLDLFVFRDPRWNKLLSSLQNNAVYAVTRTDCRTEWHIVLQYRNLPINDMTRPHICAEFDTLISCLNSEELVPRTDICLPTCKDKNDQKFLELTLSAQATTLITKDKALLKLARKTAQMGIFTIITPQAWVNAH